MSIAIEDIETLDEMAVEQLEGRFEYINGHYVEKPPMGARSNHVGARLNSRLLAFVEDNELGFCFSNDCGYRIFADEPKRRRYPDGSFVRAGRLQNEMPPDGDVTIPPDLAYEVVYPNDRAENLHERIKDFMDAGVRLLWVISPETKQVFVYRADGRLSRLGQGEELSGEDVIPGFSLSLAFLFKHT